MCHFWAKMVGILLPFLRDKNMLSFNNTKLLIESYQAFNQTEVTFKAQVLDFLEKNPQNFADRHNPNGHLTASAWILDKTFQKCLLIHHAKLQRWFQAGGHIEPEDTSLEQAALREATEETGLKNLETVSGHPQIWDIDIHPIPENKQMPAHLHLDIRFAFVATDEEFLPQLAEITDVKWINLSEMPHYNDSESLLRMVSKTLALCEKI